MASPSLTLEAPAKINLWLRIVRKRPDGFHELESRLVPIALSDTLHVGTTDGPRGTVLFTCSDPTVPADGSNLVLKAVAALAEKRGPLPGLRIHLEKRIPHGAGLGGGSSDAASTLLGLNRLLSLGLSVGDLSPLAAQFGSDIPFFLHGCACDVSGRGEIVTPQPGFAPALPLLLIKPAFGVPTPTAYRDWASSEEIPGIPYAAQLFPWGNLVNDLERPVFAKHLFLADLKMWLLARPEVAGALMSGSGSTIFAILSGEADSTALTAAIRTEFGADLWIQATRTLARSPGAAPA